ncbi:MAG: UPF0149 family protein [Cardiobacteriaceae bacterium]|nr:UPF0149 family protein [Cardiobacteriaceae bacterium]
MNSPENHAALQNLVEQHEWWFTASEAHGILSALVAFHHADAAPALLGDAASVGDWLPALLRRLDEALSGDELAYQLWLPENADSAQRAEALVQWTLGFLLATNYCERNFALKLDSEAQDFVNDLQAISQLDTDIDDSEDNQAELTDLEEHCRMGALLLYATSRTRPQNTPTH